MEYKTVFEHTDAGLNLFSLIPVFLVLGGLCILAFTILLLKDKPQEKKQMVLFGLVFIAFVAIIKYQNPPDGWSMSKRYKYKDIFENKEYQIVEAGPSGLTF